MKVTDLNEFKAEKSGEVTVKGIIDDLTKGCEQGNIKSIVCVVLSSNDEILLSCNDMEGTEAIGLLECGKQNLLNDMYDYE